MMEESSDESAEIVDKDEAVCAEQQFTVQQTQTVVPPAISSPSPLPAFLLRTTPDQLGESKENANLTMSSDCVSPVSPMKGSVAVQQVLPPGPQETPYEASSAISVVPHESELEQISPNVSQSGLLGWLSGNKMLNKVMEKTKSSVETMITTLDPGMKEVIRSGGDLCILVTSTKESKLGAIREAFQQIFGRATVIGKSVGLHLAVGLLGFSLVAGGHAGVGHQIEMLTSDWLARAVNKDSPQLERLAALTGLTAIVGSEGTLLKESQATTAAQPVGFTAGMKGAQERIQNLRQGENISVDQPVVSVEGFIVEMLPDRWYEMSCLILQDSMHRIDLQTFSQPSPIPTEYILKAQDETAKDYPLRWSGFAVTIGQIIENENPHIGHADWQNGMVGVSRRESLFLAAKSLAYMYKQRLPTAFVS